MAPLYNSVTALGAATEKAATSNCKQHASLQVQTDIHLAQCTVVPNEEL